MRYKRSLLTPCVAWIFLLHLLVPPLDACVRRICLEGAVPEPDAPHENIRLDSGEVTIRLGRPCSIDAVFVFFNTGETTTQRIGIPTLIDAAKQGSDLACPTPVEIDLNRSSSLEVPDPRDPIVGLRDLQMWVDGRSGALSEERDFLKGGGVSSEVQDSPRYKPERRWMVTKVIFPGRAKTTIRYRYKIPYAVYRPIARFPYGTGRVWKGNIGRLAFIIDCTDVGGTENVRVGGDFRNDSGKVLRSENLIIMEKRDFKPASAAHLSLSADRYYGEIAEMVVSWGLDDHVAFPSGPPSGQPPQMWSRVDWEPKFTDPFFKSKEWSYPNGIIKRADGQYYYPLRSIQLKKEPRRLKHTAKCVSTSSGTEHLVKFCEARKLDVNTLDLLIYDHNLADIDALRVQVRNGMFTSQYWTLYKSNIRAACMWTTKLQKLTLDKRVYRKGDVVKGMIDFECLEEHTDPRYVKKYGSDPTSIKLYGVFETIVK